MRPAASEVNATASRARGATFSFLAADAGLGEGRHAVVAGERGLDDARWRASRPRPRPGACRDRAAAPCRGVRAAGDGRARPSNARRGNDRALRGSGRASTAAAAVSRVAVEQHRHARHARGDDRADDGREFAPAEAAQEIERILGGGVRCSATPSSAPPRSCCRVPSPATPVPGPTQSEAAPPKRPQHKRRGRGGVGDAHLAQRRGDRCPARPPSCRRPWPSRSLPRSSPARRVKSAVGSLERHFIDAQIGIDRAAQLVDRRAAIDEVLHHLRRHRGGIGGDAQAATP